MPIDLLAESQPADLLAGEPLPKPRGMISAFGAGAKSTVGSVAQAAGRFAGMPDVAKWGEEVQAGAAPVGEEGLPAHVARAVGGMAAYLPAIISTAAVLPEATGAGVAALGLNAARGFAAMALPATVAKINRSADLKSQGVDEGTAEAAGWTEAATTGLMGVVPVAMAGKLTTRLATGAGSNIAVGELARHAQNVVLSDNPEQQSKFAAVDLATNGIVGAFMGGVLGRRPIKADISKAATDAQKLIDNPDALLEFEKPAKKPLEIEPITPAVTRDEGMPFEPGLSSKLELAPAGEPYVAPAPVVEVPPAAITEVEPAKRSYAQNETLAIYEIENIANKLKELGVDVPARTEPKPLSEMASQYKKNARKAGIELTQESLQAGHLQNLRDASLELQKVYADARAEVDAIAASRMSEADKRAATREVLRKSAERGTRPIIGQTKLFEGGYGIAREPVIAEAVVDTATPKEQGTLMKGQRFKTQKEVLTEQAEERRNIMVKMGINPDFWGVFANEPLSAMRKMGSVRAARMIDAARAKELGIKPEGAKIEETPKAVTPETKQPEAAAAALIPEEIQNAIQKPSPEGVPVRQAPEIGEGMGAQVRGAEEFAKEGQGRNAAVAREEIAPSALARAREEIASGPFAESMAAAEARVSERLSAKDVAEKAEADRLNARLRAEAGILGENIPEGLGRNISKEGRYADEPAVEAAAAKHWDETRATDDGVVPKYRDLSSGAQEWVQSAMNRFGRVPEEFYRGAMEAHAKGEIFKSETGVRIGKPSTAASVKTELVKDFADEGRLFRQTVIHETQADAKAAGELSQDYAGRAKGWYNSATNKVHLIAENIEQGRVLGVFLHEMGVHAGMDKMVGKPGMEWLTSRVEDWAKLNDGSQEALAAKEAIDRASRSTSADPRQERVAYMVEALVNAGVKPKAGKGAAGWLHRIIGLLKIALEKLHLKAESYSGQNLIDLAYGAANLELGAVRMPISFPGFRTGAQSGFRFSEVDAAKSPQNTFNAIEGVVKSVTDSVEKAAPLAVDRASAAGRKLWLYTSGLGHIVDVVKTLKWLPTAGQEALTRLSLKLHEGDALNRNINHEATQVYDLQRRLKGGSLEALAELKGPMRRANAYPFEDDAQFEKRTGAVRTPEQARDYRRSRQLYDMEGVAKAYDAERAFNKKLHDMRVTAILRSLAQSEGMPRDVWEPVSAVEGINSPAAKRLLQSIKSLEKTNVDSFGRFKSLLDLNEASHAPAYFHEARFGDYVTHFEIADTPGAVAAVQNALKVAGVKDQIVLTPADRGNRVFLKFANESEMFAVSNKLKELQAAGYVQAGFTAGKMAEKLKELDSSAPTFARAMMERINEDTQMLPEEKSAQMELVRRMYIGMLPEGNASKLYARNARVGGYSSDMARAFAEQSGMEAYYISQHAIRPDVSAARSDLRTTVGNMGKSTLPDATGEVRQNAGYDPVNQVKATDVLDEVNNRIANKIAPVHTPIQDKLLAFGHTAGLTLSPGYLIQNLFQNIHLTWPILGGRHGFVNSAKELGKAASDAVKLLNLTARGAYKDGGIVGVADSSIAIDASNLAPVEKAALKAAVAAGRLEFTRAGEMSHIREGSSPRVERALKIANTVAYYGEVFNRITAALAAHRLETARLTKENTSRPADKRLTAEEISSRANTYMVDTIDNSQINYTEADMPRFAGKHGVFKSASPLLLQFQRYNISVLQTLGKLALQSVAKVDAAPGTPEHVAQLVEQQEARKSLRGLMATTTALAGTMGLPLMGVIAGAYNALAGSDDQPADFKTDMQNWTADIAGQDMGQLVSHGAFDYMTGAAISGKVGLDNLLPFTQLASQLVDQRRKFKDRIDAGAFQFLGPSIGTGANMAQGLGMIADGRIQQGLEKVSPAATRGLVKAYGLAEHGFTDAGGHSIGKDAAWNDIAVQAMGISPTEVSRRMEAVQGVKAIEGGLNLRVSEIQDRFVRAVDAGDVSARTQIIDEVTAFRRANPTVKIDLGAAVQRARRVQASAVASGVGIAGSAKQMQAIREQTRFLQE